jgi:hypothetical protein
VKERFSRWDSREKGGSGKEGLHARIAQEGGGYLCSSHVDELLTGEENSW